MQVIQENPSPWVQYNQKNRRDEKMAQLWIKPLLNWIQNPTWQGFPKLKHAQILDFGCGYLDAGIGLRSLADRIDGFDIDPLTISKAKERLDAFKINGHIFHQLSEIPFSTYDLVIANSVFQYLKDISDVKFHLDLLLSYLNPHGALLISDLIPTSYSPIIDAFYSITYAAQHGCLTPMIKHLWFASTKSTNLKILKIDRQVFEDFCRQKNVSIHFLQRNLTPSPLRYSAVITKR